MNTIGISHIYPNTNAPNANTPRNLRQTLNSRTASIYAIRWLDPNTLLTANYDSTCRIHDVRANCDVITWMDPYDAAVYSLASDGQHGVLCGMSMHCRVNMYDQRQAAGCVQMFYPQLDIPSNDSMRQWGPQRPIRTRRPWHYSRGSPVYSLACDATQLFVATDLDLRVLDFSAHWARSRDYRNCFENIIIS